MAQQNSKRESRLLFPDGRVDKNRLVSRPQKAAARQAIRKCGGCMKALDLFCKAGGASMGLHRAGFEVTGVDVSPQPRYPFRFLQGDALTVDLRGYDLIWASPPCQRYVRGGLVKNQRDRPDLIEPVRAMLKASGTPWILENVPGAPIRPDIVLCGSHFDLPIRRHRWFEVSFRPPLARPCDHSQPIHGIYGQPSGKAGKWPGMLPDSRATWSAAMGIDWMLVEELSQAIPPAYAEFLGQGFLTNVNSNTLPLS